MTTMHELSGFQRDLLFVIRGLAGPNGQDIRAELQQSMDGEVQQSRLYSNLNELVEMGLVEKHRESGRTNRYTTTSEGRETLEIRHRWERQYVETARTS